MARDGDARRSDTSGGHGGTIYVRIAGEVVDHRLWYEGGGVVSASGYEELPYAVDVHGRDAPRFTDRGSVVEHGVSGRPTEQGLCTLSLSDDRGAGQPGERAVPGAPRGIVPPYIGRPFPALVTLAERATERSRSLLGTAQSKTSSATLPAVRRTPRERAATVIGTGAMALRAVVHWRGRVVHRRQRCGSARQALDPRRCVQRDT